MHSKGCFYKRFGSESVNESKKFLESTEKYFYPTFSSFWAKLSQKKLFLIRSKILGLFDNTLIPNYEYFRSNRENLHIPIEIKLSEKLSIFWGIFFLFLGSTLNLPCSERKRNPHRWSISEVIESERCAYLNA